MTKSKTADEQLIPAVGYIRMSTDDQKNSPERQRGEIIALAERDGYKILRWYEDHGLTGTKSKNRPAFQEMMAVVPSQEFKAILLYERSRFSREDFFDTVAHWKVLHDSNVQLVSVLEGHLNLSDLGGLICGVVKTQESRNEVIRLAQRTLSGKKDLVKTGAHVARAPFGFDREIFDQAGNFIRRVRLGETFRMPVGWKSKLVPSDDPAIVEGVQYMFDALIRGVSTRQIAIELNRRKLTPYSGKPFQRSVVRQMLRNPAYMGTLHFGKQSRGEHAKLGKLIVVSNAHEPLVTKTTFEDAQAVLRASDQQHGCSANPGKYPLTGIIHCGRCGRRMTGWSSGDMRRYVCVLTETNPCQPAPTVTAEAIEQLVLRLILQHVLVKENSDKLEAAMERLIVSNEQATSSIDGKLQELRTNIARAERNLKLLEGDNFIALANDLDEMRREVERLKQRKKSELKSGNASRPDVLSTLRESLRDDSVKLAIAIKRTVNRITIVRKTLPKTFKTDLTVRGVQGVIEFDPEIFPHPIAYDDSDLYPEMLLKEVAKYVIAAKRPVSAAEIGEAFEIPKDSALNRAKRAVRLGMMTYRQRGNLFLFEAMAN